jgi:2-(1,2-epoxy-1,2-dihydrophenyl)acetyl-CoA isomerase
MSETLLVSTEDGIETMTLNRPQVMNAFNEEMNTAFREALRKAETDGTVCCVVITGAGKAFCSGQDLKDRVPNKKRSLGDSLRRLYNPVILKIRALEKPVIAAVNGVAAGAGCNLALACDLRVASEQASFIEAFARVGLAPDSGGSFFLPRLVGLGRAFEMMLTGEAVSAKEALRIGLVNRVVSQDRLMEETKNLCMKLCQGPPKGIGLIKRALNKGITQDLESQLDYEAHLQEIAGNTEDYNEALKAFAEKRRPQFKGR